MCTMRSLKLHEGDRIAIPKVKGKDTLKYEEEDMVFIDYRFTITYMANRDKLLENL